MVDIYTESEQEYLENIARLSSLERFTHWIKEREKVRLKKGLGEKPPWTPDPILRRYRFTCCRRMDDKVSQWLLNNWYLPYKDHPNMLESVALARFINLPSSLEYVTRWVFPRDNGSPLWEEIKAEFRGAKVIGHNVFNNAYMVRGNDGQDKVSSVVDFYVKSLIGTQIDPSSMEKTHARISKVYGFGSFMAGQVVADLRWAISGTWADKDTWAPIGPGSKRGMNRIQGRPVNIPLGQVQFLRELTEVVKWCKVLLPVRITENLEMIDFQSALCETDKYNRVLFGEGRPKARYPGK